MNTDKELLWCGIEAKKGGFPILFRIRRVAIRPDFENLFVISWSYSVDNSSRLPDADLYRKLEVFERNVIEKLEQENLGIFVASETGLGKVRYYLYSSSVEDLTMFLDARIPMNDSVEFASDNDPEWREYSNLIRLIQ